MLSPVPLPVSKPSPKPSPTPNPKPNPTLSPAPLCATLLAVAALLALAPAARAQTPTPTFTVTVLTDPATGAAAHCTNQAATGATPDANCSLRDAFAAVDALGYLGTTSTQPNVNFAPALTASAAQTITLAATLVISHNFNLIGPGASLLTLSGNKEVAIMNQANTSSTPSLSTVSGISFYEGLAKNYSGSLSGAAWYSADNGNATFVNVIFNGNKATTASNSVAIQGGTIYEYDLTLTGCLIESNTASVPNSTTTNSFGGIVTATILSAGSSSANSTAFMNNTTSGAGSGGTSLGMVYANSTTISGAQFENNVAAQGVVVSFGGTIANTSFISNTADTGFISNTAVLGTLLIIGPMTISNTTFSQNAGGIQNFGQTVTITGSSFSNNTPSSGGAFGNIFNNNGVLAVDTTSFSDTFATGTYYSWFLYNTGTATVTNSLFMSSNPEDIQSVGSTATLKLTGVTVFSGYVGSSSGAVTSIYNDTLEAQVYNDGSSTVNVYNSVLSGGTSNAGNTGGGYTDKGGNCIASSCATYLSPLGNYGGPLQTVLPLPGGTLIAGGVVANTNGATTDARGYPRVYTHGQYSFVDIGATQSAYTLAFAQQPTSTAPGSTITPAPAVQLYESGVAFADSGLATTISAASGTLSGTKTQSTSATGLATFPGLSIGTVQSSDTLTAQLVLSALSGGNYNATMTSNTFYIIAGSTAQTITFPQPSPGVANGSATITASSTSGLPITFSVTSGNAAIIVTNTSNGVSTATINYYAAGSVTIAANQPGNATYAPATTVSRTVSVAATGSTAQTITFPQPHPGVANGSATITATTTSGLPITFSITSGSAGIGSTTTTGSGPSTVSSATITYNGPGAVTIAANQSGNPTYAAAPTVTQTVNVYTESVWVINSDTTVLKLLTTGTGPTQSGNPNGASTQGGIAFDASGNSWSVANQSTNLYKTSSADDTPQGFGGYGGINDPTALAIDGNGYIWIANAGNNAILPFKNDGTPLTGNNGYASGMLQNPSSITIDNTGGLWLTNQMGNSVTHIFGAAAPVATPLTNAVGNATLGAKP